MRRLARIVPGSTTGSKVRNLLSYYAVSYTILLLVEVGLAEFGNYGMTASAYPLAIFLMAVSTVTTGAIVLGPIFIHSVAYPLRPARFVRDVCVSATFQITAFALLYRYIGISSGAEPAADMCFPSGGCICDGTPADQLYFSIVVFATLGFGDFTACSYKLISAAEALSGTVHLGLFAGAIFLYLGDATRQRHSKRSSEDGDPDEGKGHSHGDHERGGDSGMHTFRRHSDLPFFALLIWLLLRRK